MWRQVADAHLEKGGDSRDILEAVFDLGGDLEERGGQGGLLVAGYVCRDGCSWGQNRGGEG